MYRAVTLYMLENGVVSENEGFDEAELIDSLSEINISFNFNRTTGNSETFLNGTSVEHDIRGLRVARCVSQVSKVKHVRDKLVYFQQQLGKNKGVVMDGRDIGSKVLPEAELKLFVTASIEVRTARRYKELVEKGVMETVESVQDNLKKRDFEDSNRKESPLIQVPEAVVIDNSRLSKLETLTQVLDLANEKIDNH